MSGFDRNKVLFKEEININVKTNKDILSEITFDNEDDALICESIIKSLESYAAKKINENKAVQLPYIGVVRKNPIKCSLQKQKNELKLLRKTTDKENYKQIVKEKIYNIKKEQEDIKNNNIRLNKIKVTYKKEYEKYCKTIGVAFADAFILSKTLFEYIPFDKEVQRMYDELNKSKDNE